jgi:hypothetical protein
MIPETTHSVNITYHIYSQVADPQHCKPLLREGDNNRSGAIPHDHKDKNTGNNSLPRQRTTHLTIQDLKLF